MKKAVSVSWQSEIMPAPAFAYYHAECFTPDAHQEYRVGLREVEVEGLAVWARCDSCWERFHQEEGQVS